MRTNVPPFRCTLVLVLGCGAQHPADSDGVPCWSDDPLELGETAAAVAAGPVEVWNARVLAKEYSPWRDGVLPDGVDTLSLGSFEPTGRVWSVTGPHDPYEIAARPGCFEGERVLVEGRADVASAADYFEVSHLPLVLDAPATGEGELGVFRGVDRGTLRLLDSVRDAAEFGTVISPGADAEARLEETVSAEGESWAASAIWFALLSFGDTEGRVTLGGYDPNDPADDPYEESRYALDGIFAVEE